MLVRNFLCCMPLIWGVVITGITFGTIDFIAGSIGWQMLIREEYPGWLLGFFRKMDIRICVAGCSSVFYMLAMDHFMLIFGACTANPLLVGVWFLVNFTVFLLTLVTGLLSGWALLRLIALGYSLIVVKSYYEELISPASEDEPSTEYIRVEFEYNEADA